MQTNVYSFIRALHEQVVLTTCQQWTRVEASNGVFRTEHTWNHEDTEAEKAFVNRTLIDLGIRGFRRLG